VSFLVNSLVSCYDIFVAFPFDNTINARETPAKLNVINVHMIDNTSCGQGKAKEGSLFFMVVVRPVTLFFKCFV
jgi:hypothetical protein